MPTTATSLTVPVSGLSATDDRGVTGYLITESATPPSATASGWSSTAPASFTFSGEGAKTAYAWAKDAAGNVSAAKTATVTITLPDVAPPMISAFSMPASSSSLTVSISGLAATDNVGVTGYIVTESPAVPVLSAPGWSSSAPSSFTFSGTGVKTAYAWARDAAGNVSAYKSATVTISESDLIVPIITFSAPTANYVYGPKITVSVSASDNVAVRKMELYLDGVLKLTVNSNAIKTSLSMNKGVHVIMVKAYDTSNNVSSSSKTVNRFY
ncbi:chitinase A1 precursor [Geobacter sp. OR-1]|nr:chitinase A1 precursor [Geobacter sp. OR-1]